MRPLRKIPASIQRELVRLEVAVLLDILRDPSFIDKNLPKLALDLRLLVERPIHLHKPILQLLGVETRRVSVLLFLAMRAGHVEIRLLFALDLVITVRVGVR